MRSLVLVIEHRACACGASYLAPNPRPLTRQELVNLRKTNAEVLLPGDTTTPRSTRVILHISVDIEYCPRCFHTSNGRQYEMFPRGDPIALIFAEGTIKERPKVEPNPFGLTYF